MFEDILEYIRVKGRGKKSGGSKGGKNGGGGRRGGGKGGSGGSNSGGLRNKEYGIGKAYGQANGAKQAILKITSFSSGKDVAKRHANYISRNGELPIETDKGKVIDDKAEIQKRMGEWGDSFGTRKNSRDTMNLMLSTPKGTKPEIAQEAVRKFADKHFQGKNEYHFAIHTDTANPHGHLQIKMIGYSGRKIEAKKNDLKKWRENYAEILQALGVEVVAGKGYVGDESARTVKQNVHQLQKREMSEHQKAGIELAKKNLLAGTTPTRMWLEGARNVNDDYKVAYLGIGVSVMDKAASMRSKKDRENLEKVGDRIIQYAEKIKTPKDTYGELYAIAYGKDKPSKSKGGQNDIAEPLNKDPGLSELLGRVKIKGSDIANAIDNIAERGFDLKKHNRYMEADRKTGLGR